jgi:type II secretory pathway pseudopilin PulG
MTRARHAFAFTLPEVLVSLVLVGLVLPGTMKGISLAMSAADDARKRVDAVGLAETKLEELTAAGASNYYGGTSAGDFGEEWPAYRWESSTSSIDTGLTEISVRVIWAAGGSERSLDLASFAYAASTLTTTSGSGGTPSGGAP